MKSFVTLAFLAISLAGVFADQMNVNEIVDNVITQVVETLKESHSETQSVPDFEKDFKVVFVKGGIKATNGVFEDLSTVQRTGDAILTLHDNWATLDISMGLTNMELYFEHCRAWFGKLSTSEKLSVTIGKNSIEAKATLKLVGSTCQVSLDSLSLNQFSDVQVNMKSLGKFKYIADRIVNWIVSYFDGDIRSSVESKLNSVLADELQKHDLCQLI